MVVHRDKVVMVVRGREDEDIWMLLFAYFRWKCLMAQPHFGRASLDAASLVRGSLK